MFSFPGMHHSPGDFARCTLSQSPRDLRVMSRSCCTNASLCLGRTPSHYIDRWLSPWIPEPPEVCFQREDHGRVCLLEAGKMHRLWAALKIWNAWGETRQLMFDLCWVANFDCNTFQRCVPALVPAPNPNRSFSECWTVSGSQHGAQRKQGRSEPSQLRSKYNIISRPLQTAIVDWFLDK